MRQQLFLKATAEEVLSCAACFESKASWLTLDFTCSRKRAEPAVGCQVQGRVSPLQGRICLAALGVLVHARTLPDMVAQGKPAMDADDRSANATDAALGASTAGQGARSVFA